MLLIVSYLAVITIFVACEKEEMQPDKLIVGKWITSDNNAGHNDTIHFTEEMRVEDYFVFTHSTMYSASSYYYTYSLTENVITITSYQPEETELSESFNYLLDKNSLTIKGFSNPFSATQEGRSDVHFRRVK